MGREPFRLAALAALAALWFAPLILSFAFALAPLGDAAAWKALFAHPQLWKALALSLFIGTAALIVSLVLAFLIAASFYGSYRWNALSRFAGAAMAIPHLAFAIGLGFLLMPSGLLARLIAKLITGWSAPPSWVTVQDPWGFALILALVLKETPFLLWMLWSFLSRGDAARMFEGQWRVARGLGHPPASVWTRLFLPQIAPRLIWPAIVVWVYGASVVDMALVLGPTQPPTLAVVAWHDLNAAEPSLNMRGAAASFALTLVLGFCGSIAWLLLRAFARGFRSWTTKGPFIPQTHNARHPGDLASLRRSQVAGMTGLSLFATIYAAVVALLLVMSISGYWPFPDMLPQSTHANAWTAIAATPSPAMNSILLALAAMLLAVVLAVLWFEALENRYDTILIAAAVIALALPQIMIASGQSALFLRLGWSGSFAGMLLAHLAFVFAYVAIVLAGPYRAFDPRWRSAAHGLNASGWRFWWRIKMPLLRPALAAAAAVGFAVSMAQYLPSQFLGEGRIATLTTEAVTLASGGNRALTAAFALALAIPTALAFLIAARFGRPRWGLAWS